MHSTPVDHWAFGWEALVAFGTIGLAIVTGGLAWTTLGVARATREDIAGAWRPVLLPASAQMQLISIQDGHQLLLVLVQIQNVGPGPALDVRPLSADQDQSDLPLGGPLAAGLGMTHSFSVVGSTGEWAFRVLYRDVAGHEHESRATIVGPGGLGGQCVLRNVEITAA